MITDYFCTVANSYCSAMASSVPEYYRHLAEKRRQDAADEDTSPAQEEKRQEESASEALCPTAPMPFA